MAVIFNELGGRRESLGRVHLLSVGMGGSLLTVDKWGGFERFRSIFTRYEFGEETNNQFQHMLGGDIYLTRFGDRIGTMTLSGLSFFDSCSGKEERHGIVDVRRFYHKMKLSAREEPIRVTIDPDAVLECYMLGMRAGILPDSVAERMFQFQLQLAVLPPSEEEMAELLDEDKDEEDPVDAAPVPLPTDEELFPL